MSLYGAMNTGVSALQSFTTGLETIGNNISNANTNGYKSSRANYSDSFYNTLTTVGNPDTNSNQVGGGVQVSDISGNWNQSEFEESGYSGDLGIYGEGFFQVRDPYNDNDYVTRAGTFTKDNLGYLTLGGTYRLQGEGNVDIAIPDEAVSWAFNESGELNFILQDGTLQQGTTVSLAKFTNPDGLIRSGGNLFTVDTDAVGTMTVDQPGASGLGSLRTGAYELSNVDLTVQFSKMITTQRGFQAGSRVISTSDELMEEAINLK